MDAVILAAGRNERLKGIAAPYHKPLLVVNGKALIVNAFELAAQHCERVIIVAAPENVKPICDLLADHELFQQRGHVIVQARTRGPGEALWRGLFLVTEENVLVLCADNLLTEQAVRVVVKASNQGGVIVGGRLIEDQEKAARFTRITPSMENFVENPTVEMQEGPSMCWIGPLVLPAGQAKKVFGQAVERYPWEEIKIGGLLNYVPGNRVFVEVECYDVGVQDALIGIYNQ